MHHVRWIGLMGWLAVEATLAGPRVITLGGAITETVWALGEGHRVIAVDDSSGYPAETAALPKVGYYRMVSAEGVLSLNPDLVLASDQAGPPPALAQMDAAGVPVITVPGGHGVAACTARIRAVGKALDRSEAAEDLAASIEASLAALPPPGDHPPRVLFVFARGAGTLNVSGTGTAADEIIRLAGGINAVDAYEGYRPLTSESALAAQPEFILTTTSGLQSLGGADALLATPGLANTPAGQAGQVAEMDDLLLLGFGPRLPEAVAKLREILNP
ncbi:MAG: hemin ABC transporter substrate-binding protein [Verrucomicrobia bacterium]|nr:hemin ABC transporter substrate-binding protein [Verrucomicrobiota bacterium]